MASIKDPKSQNARIFAESQTRAVSPVSPLGAGKDAGVSRHAGSQGAGGQGWLNYDSLRVKPTQDWTTHHVVFNSFSNDEALIYFGCWGGRGGSLWLDDAKLEEVGLVNLARRGGAPLEVKKEGGAVLLEGKDFERVIDPKHRSRMLKA